MTDAPNGRRKELPHPRSRPTTIPWPATPARVNPNSSREGNGSRRGSHAFEQAGSHTAENRHYIGYFANRDGEQWLFAFHRATREAFLRGGDADWGRAHAVHEGRVDGLILAPEEAAWLQACWHAAAT